MEQDANYRDAYDALGEEFHLARSLTDANETVRLTQPQRARRQRTPRRAGREIRADAGVHRLILRSDSHAVRFLSAVAAATHGKLLMALDCDDGEPKFHQLEPDRRLAATS
jgi:hypothetical protein